MNLYFLHDDPVRLCSKLISHSFDTGSMELNVQTPPMTPGPQKPTTPRPPPTGALKPLDPTTPFTRIIYMLCTPEHNPYPQQHFPTPSTPWKTFVLWESYAFHFFNYMYF